MPRPGPLVLVPLIAVLSLAAAGCRTPTAARPAASGPPTEPAAEATAAPTAYPPGSPERVTESFYAAYLDADGDRLAERAYADAPGASEAFVAEIDEALAAPERGAIDPIVCSESVPDEIVVNPASIDTSAGPAGATVLVEGRSADRTVPTIVTVFLEQAEDRWQVRRVACSSEVAGSASDPADIMTGESPEMATEAFYMTYLGHRGDALEERAYAESPYATDALIAALDAAPRDGTDPVLCAAGAPSTIRIGEASTLGETARVTIELGYPDGTRAVTAELVRQGDSWRLDAIRCPE